MDSEIDDRTAAYVVEALPVFEDLRQVAAQLAGLLVLAATHSKDATPDHPMLTASTRVFAHASDGVTRVGGLLTGRSRLHHANLVSAGAALERAIACAGAWPLDIDAVLIPLRDAYAHLQQAASALPGFQMVAFDQGCCGVTAARPTSP